MHFPSFVVFLITSLSLSLSLSPSLTYPVCRIEGVGQVVIHMTQVQIDVNDASGSPVFSVNKHGKFMYQTTQPVNKDKLAAISRSGSDGRSQSPSHTVSPHELMSFSYRGN